MTEKQKDLLSEAYDMEAMSNVLKTNLKRAFDSGSIQAQDVERAVSLHDSAVRLQEMAEGLE